MNFPPLEIFVVTPESKGGGNKMKKFHFLSPTPPPKSRKSRKVYENQFAEIVMWYLEESKLNFFISLNSQKCHGASQGEENKRK